MAKIYWKDAFLLEGINTIPSDALLLDENTYNNLLKEQQKGKRIVSNKSGHPIAIDYEKNTKQTVRNLRDRLLMETDYLVLPDYPLTKKQSSEIKIYRQALRDLTTADGFPWDGVNIPFPPLPEFIKLKKEHKNE